MRSKVEMQSVPNTGYTGRLGSPKPFATLRASYSPTPLYAMQCLKKFGGKNGI